VRTIIGFLFAVVVWLVTVFFEAPFIVMDWADPWLKAWGLSSEPGSGSSYDF